MFRYATTADKSAMLLATVAAAIAGAALSTVSVIIGAFTEHFSDFLKSKTTSDQFAHDTRHLALYFVYLGIISFIGLSMSTFGFTLAAESTTYRLRKTYLSALLHQKTSYFDTTGPGEITTHITSDTNHILDTISHKLSLLLTGIFGFLAALIIALSRNWRLALVLLCMPVTMIVIMGTMGAYLNKMQQRSSGEYARSADFAEDVFSCARSVIADGAQGRLVRRYRGSLGGALGADLKGKGAMAMMIATIMMVILWGYGLAFWQGNRFLQNGHSTLSEIVTVLLTCTMAGVLLGQSAPFAASVLQARVASAGIYETIDRVCGDSVDSGEWLDSVQGDIEFSNVRFAYPSRETKVILDGFNLRIEAGKSTAIVGPSGAGKSTLIALLERWYDPVEGEITLDGRPVNELNLRWLRSQIGLVSQDPFLFNASIYDNIKYGLGGDDQLSEEKLTESIYEAAKLANIHDFILDLPEGYSTKVGQAGGLLSGGQRQRIAIARAIISNPRILLLDEATAALDTKNENAVQEALQTVSQGRTTLVIAHRLSTIQKADRIALVEHGRVVEQGTHDELMATDSTYSKLVHAQGFTQDHLPHTVEKDSDETKISQPKQSTHPPSHQPTTTPSTRSTTSLISLVYALNKPERPILLLGIFASAFAGAGYPIQAIFFGNAVVSIISPSLSTNNHPPKFWALMYLLLGVAQFLLYTVQGMCFASASARLSYRTRVKAFTSLINKDLSFFHSADHTSGALVTFLSTEASKLTGISGTTLGAILNSAMTLVSAIAVSCSFGWKLGLVATSTIPILLACGFLRFWVISWAERNTKRSTAAAAAACEAVSSIQTITSLGIEDRLVSQYCALLQAEKPGTLRFNALSSIVYAASQSLVFWVTGFLFWYGGSHLVATGEYSVQRFFICFTAVVWSSQAAGMVFSYAPDISGARDAAARLGGLISGSGGESEGGKGVSVEDGDGMGVVFEGVGFGYSGSNGGILHDIDLVAEEGKFTAIVGPSGGGKSTILSLIERFYDPVSGSVRIGGRDIREYDIAQLRKQMSFVGQGAWMVGGTVRECLAVGDEEIQEEELVHMCEKANIYDFIISLPHGFDTPIGGKGSQLSGGQKQKLAITRALLRKPRILLLDEATSALDSVSEKHIRNSLATATKGRTTIAVAHHLVSISHADRIYVVDQGRILESGTHDTLLAQKGLYWQLFTLQTLERGTQ